MATRKGYRVEFHAIGEVFGITVDASNPHSARVLAWIELRKSASREFVAVAGVVRVDPVADIDVYAGMLAYCRACSNVQLDYLGIDKEASNALRHR